MTDRIYHVKFEDNKGLTSSPKSKKDRQNNGITTRKYGQTTQKTKDRTTWINLKTRGNSGGQDG